MKQFYSKAIRFLLIFFITTDPITNLWMLVQIAVLTDMWMWIMLVIVFLCPGCFSHSYYLLCSIWLLPSTKVLSFCSDVIMQQPWRLSYKLLPYSALSTLLVVPTPLRDPVYDYTAKRLWVGMCSQPTNPPKSTRPNPPIYLKFKLYIYIYIEIYYIINNVFSYLALPIQNPITL